MRKGKPVQKNLPKDQKSRVASKRAPVSGRQSLPPDTELETDFEDSPSEDDFTVKTRGRRRSLTAEDIEHNRRVAAFFNRVKPGIPIDADAPELRREPAPLSVMVEKILKKMNINESPWLDGLNRAWPELVAPEVARVARPGKFADGILFIFVTSSVKLFELRRFHLRAIEQAVRSFPGSDRVKQVRLMVNTVSLP